MDSSCQTDQIDWTDYYRVFAAKRPVFIEDTVLNETRHEPILVVEFGLEAVSASYKGFCICDTESALSQYRSRMPEALLVASPSFLAYSASLVASFAPGSWLARPTGFQLCRA